ncbi:hypothetical protein HDU96_006380 [Phlyctochytrium bullatum]|nr:hypothetical protein HDU96_006380 [Phlyctochytrium bullatum]
MSASTTAVMAGEAIATMSTIIDRAASQQLNPDHDVTVITPATLHRHVGIPTPKFFPLGSPEHRREWTKLAVLVERGGIFMDPSTVLTDRVGFIHAARERSQASTLAFYDILKMNVTKSPAADPVPGLVSILGDAVLEPHLLAAVPRAQLVWSWFNEYNFVLGNFKGSDALYLDHLSAIFGNTGAFWDLEAALASRPSLAGSENSYKTPVSMHLAFYRVVAETSPATLPAPLNRDRVWDLNELVKARELSDARNPRLTLQSATVRVIEDLFALGRWNTPEKTGTLSKIYSRRPRSFGQAEAVRATVEAMERRLRSVLWLS